MTITTVVKSNQYAGNGATTSFDFDFRIYDETELVVTLIDDATQTGSVLVGGYTVSGVGDSGGGTVDLDDAPAVGETLDLRPVYELEQPTNFRNTGRFLPERHENSYDRLTSYVHYLSRLATNALRLPDQGAADDGELANVETRKGKFLYFDDTTGEVTYALSITGTTLTQIVFDDFLIDSPPYESSSAEISAGVIPSSFFYREGDLRRYGALGDNSNDDAAAARTGESVLVHHSYLHNGLTFKFVPTGSSPYYFGNATGSLVYAGVLIDISDYMVDGEGSKIHVVSRPGVAGTDIQYAYITNKNLVMGTQTNIVFNGTTVDTNNDGDAANSNQRGYYLTGVDVVRLLNTRTFSSGARRGGGGNFQNCKNVQVVGHMHRKVTQGFNLRYTQNALFVGCVWDDFSECIDLDGTQDRTVIVGNTFESTSRANQMIDCNGQVDGVFSGFTAYNLGQIANISHKFTTPDNFPDYVNNVAAVVKTPSQRVIVSNFAARAIGSASSVVFVIGNDWSDGGHAGYEGPHDIYIGTGMVEDTSYIMIWECERLKIRDLYLGGVITAATLYAVDMRGLIGTGDQRSWSTLTGLIDGLTIKGCDRGAVRAQNALSLALMNMTISGADTLSTGAFGLAVTGLIERGAQIWIDGLNITKGVGANSGNVNINGNSASIAAWAPTTSYRRSEIRSNGGRYYRMLNDSGTSGAGPGPTGIGTNISEGTCLWEYISEPFSIYWGMNNKLGADCQLVFTGDAHKFTHGIPVNCDLGDLAATGTVSRPIYLATRKCYVSIAKALVNANVGADAVNFRTFQMKSLTNLGATTTTISSTSTAAGLTAYVAYDLGFAINEVGAYLEPGDVMYVDITSTAAGKALTGLQIQIEVLLC